MKPVREAAGLSLAAAAGGVGIGLWACQRSGQRMRMANLIIPDLGARRNGFASPGTTKRETSATKHLSKPP